MRPAVQQSRHRPTRLTKNQLSCMTKQSETANDCFRPAQKMGILPSGILEAARMGHIDLPRRQEALNLAIQAMEGQLPPHHNGTVPNAVNVLRQMLAHEQE